MVNGLVPQEAQEASAPVGAPAVDSKGAACRDPLYCAVCGVRTTSQLDMNAHLKGQRHRVRPGTSLGAVQA